MYVAGHTFNNVHGTGQNVKQNQNELKPFPYFSAGHVRRRGRRRGGRGRASASGPRGRRLLLLLLLSAVVEHHQLHLTAHSDRVVRLLQMKERDNRLSTVHTRATCFLGILY